MKRFTVAVRRHWAIENSLHSVLDVTFREDESRSRARRPAENLTALRRLAVGLLKHASIIWADAAYRAVAERALVKWLWVVEIVTRLRGKFVLQKKRWIVERTFGWLNRSRRLAKSFERTIESDTAFAQVAMIHLMVTRL